MTRILHLNASPRGTRSRSLALADMLVAQLARALPSVCRTRLDLFGADLPRFDGPAVEGRYRMLHGLPAEPHEEAAWKRLQAAAREALAHPLWLINTPMWNFGPPYPLKQWIDAVTHPGLLFTVDPAGTTRGLATGQRLVIVAASAMPFLRDPAIAGLDFQVAYLRAWAGFIGIAEVEVIRIAPTFGPAAEVDAAMMQARTKAGMLAERLILAAGGDARD